jgi:hypothetical protein
VADREYMPMTGIDTLKSLRERCRVAEKADREIDVAILRMLGYTWRGMDYWHHDDKRIWKGSTFFTGSVDAALALVERLLPGWCYSVHRNEDGHFGSVWAPGQGGGPGSWVVEMFDEKAVNPALALICAALSAKIAEMEGATRPLPDTDALGLLTSEHTDEQILAHLLPPFVKGRDGM